MSRLSNVNKRFFDVLHGFPLTGALINEYPVIVDTTTGMHQFNEGDVVKLVDGPDSKPMIVPAEENETARCGVVINDGYDYDGEFTGKVVVAHSGLRIITDNIDTAMVQEDIGGTPTDTTPNFKPGKGVYANDGAFQLEYLKADETVANGGRRVGELQRWDESTGRAEILWG